MTGLVAWLPKDARNWIMAFEATIESSVAKFSDGLEDGARLLDAGAGEGRYRRFFSRHRYVGLDLGIGDANWDYADLDVVGNLDALPFRDGSMDAALSIVTLEHVRSPARVVSEMSRVLKSGGRLLLVVPQEWEMHQHPHDFFRFTRFGVEMMLQDAGMKIERLEAGGGYFRLLSRRLLEGAKILPFPFSVLWLIAVAPAALLLPLADGLDRKKDHTLGYFAVARKAARESE